MTGGDSVRPARLTRRRLLVSFVASGASMLGSDKGVLAAVREMENRDGLKLVNPGALRRRPLLEPPYSSRRTVGVRAISPDACAIVYWAPVEVRQPVGTPFLTVERVSEGALPIRLEGQGAYLCGVSSGATVIIVRTVSLVQLGRKSLLALDLKSGITVYDLTPYIRQVELRNINDPRDLECISVSGPGTFAALGSREQIQVIEIPSGKTVYIGPGRFPKLSPNGTRLAFIHQEHLYIRSLVDSASKEFLPGVRVMGSGGWSPDGRFLAAGAWTKQLAFEKRQIIVDTTTGEYGVIGKLGEGDYGDEFEWISIRLLDRRELEQPEKE